MFFRRSPKDYESASREAKSIFLFHDNLFGGLALTADVDARSEVIAVHANALQVEVFNRSIDVVSRNSANACGEALACRRFSDEAAVTRQREAFQPFATVAADVDVAGKVPSNIVEVSADAVSDGHLRLQEWIVFGVVFNGVDGELSLRA